MHISSRKYIKFDYYFEQAHRAQAQLPAHQAPRVPPAHHQLRAPLQRKRHAKQMEISKFFNALQWIIAPIYLCTHYYLFSSLEKQKSS